VLFAAATGLRPGEWIALEHRDIDRDARVVYVRCAYRNGRIKYPKTEASIRAVPLQTIALAALKRLPANGRSPLVFPSPGCGYFDLHNFRNRYWKPAQLAAGITPLRRIYDLRHTFATFALRAGISTFDLSRYMGTSLGMIDRRYGHLARDGRQHAIRLLDLYTGAERSPTSTRWTLRGHRTRAPSPTKRTQQTAEQAKRDSPLPDSNRRPPPYQFSPANSAVRGTGDASPDVARVVSDVSGSCPLAVDRTENAR
jgi:hypothetical protein